MWSTRPIPLRSNNVATFLYLSRCGICPSSDARAFYSDGSSFCFSCRKPLSSTSANFVPTQVFVDSKHSYCEPTFRLPSSWTSWGDRGSIRGILQRTTIQSEELRRNNVFVGGPPSGL